jgi:hypothetical protein
MAPADRIGDQVEVENRPVRITADRARWIKELLHCGTGLTNFPSGCIYYFSASFADGSMSEVELVKTEHGQKVVSEFSVNGKQAGRKTSSVFHFSHEYEVEGKTYAVSFKVIGEE